MIEGTLQKLVEMRGIETHYIDAWGKPTTISTASQTKLLTAFGYDCSNHDVIHEQIASELSDFWCQPVNPVYVLRQNDPQLIQVRLPISHVNEQLHAKIEMEQGEVVEYSFSPVDQVLVNVGDIDELEFHEYLTEIPEALPLGYHQLTLLLDESVLGTSKLVLAPQRCFFSSAIKGGKKPWGFSIQLYCLRSEGNWGIGDFSDLTQLVTYAAQMGADFIGLNPIHALFPSNPDTCSPYGPSSRRWINYLYLDVTQLPCFDTEAVQNIVLAEDFVAGLTAAKREEYVDYQQVAQLKLLALNALFDTYYTKYLTKNTKQNKAFKAFIRASGESLTMQATFDAMQEYLTLKGESAWGWPAFPAEWQQYDNDEVSTFAKKHKRRIQFYTFLQWQASLQLDAVQKAAIKAGMTIGLYRDLAVGVSEGSAEVWGNNALYCTAASVGAPPDVLGPLGQNWGLPPMDPVALTQQGYQPIVDLFSSNMKSSGALRIDHVMGLLRLWLVVDGEGPKDGAYMYYPVDDLLGILALESHRNEVMVIGEDLGTVPDEIRQKLADNGIFSYKVFFFEKAPDGGFFSPQHYPQQSMATLTTHDMPTLLGYWHCLDLELGKELGLYNDESVLSNLYATRHADKQAILDSLNGHGRLSDNISRDVNAVGMDSELNRAIHVHMAHGSSKLLCFQLEDWLQMDKPVNVPGTFMEYPNWRRKLSLSLEDIMTNSELRVLGQEIQRARSADCG